MDTQQETIRQIAKREYDAVNSNGIYSSTGMLGWSIWKRAYDSAAANLSNIHQQKIEQYREWLADQGVHSVTNYPKIWAKFNEMFPVEHTSEEPVPTLQQKVDMMQGDLTDYSDETDNIYPKH